MLWTYVTAGLVLLTPAAMIDDVPRSWTLAAIVVYALGVVAVDAVIERHGSALRALMLALGMLGIVGLPWFLHRLCC